jgi:hypothetical protein
MYFALRTVARPHVGAYLAKRQNDVTMPQASKANVASGALTHKLQNFVCVLSLKVFDVGNRHNPMWQHINHSNYYYYYLFIA